MVNVVQIGTNDGSDHVQEFVRMHSKDVESVTLVEPFVELNDTIQRQYEFRPNVGIINAVVTDGNSTNVAIYYDRIGDYRKSSTNIQHLLDHGIPLDRIDARHPTCISINDLLSSRQPIDFLFIDAEGSDFSIVNNIDLDKFPIGCIVFESAHTDGTFTRRSNFQLLVKKLTTAGYYSRTFLLDTIASKSMLTLTEVFHTLVRYGHHQPTPPA